MVRRWLVQLLAAVACNGNFPGFLNGQLYRGPLKSVCIPGLNCYSCPGALGACPIGSISSALSGIVLRIPFYVTGLLMAFGLFFGRFICGWLCPFGFIQDILHRIPSPKLGKSAFTQRLSWLRYGFLAFTILGPLALFALNGVGDPVFCKYICPAGTLEAALPLLALKPQLFQAAGWITVLKASLLVLFLIAMVFLYRPFCRFVCPLGAWYGLWNRMAVLGVAVDKAHCTHCGKCSRVCPMDSRIAGDAGCISCGRCLPHCPEKAIAFRQPLSFFEKKEEFENEKN